MLRKELDAEKIEEIDRHLEGQCELLFKATVEADNQLTKHNILLNSGSTAALLAFIGSVPNATWLLLPLVIFITGVISALIELRANVEALQKMHFTALRIRSKFRSNEIGTQGISVDSPEIQRLGSIGKWAGIYSQVAFIIGVVVAAHEFFVHAAA